MKSAECFKEILEAKNIYILAISKKLEDSKTAPKNVLDYIKPFNLQ